MIAERYGWSWKEIKEIPDEEMQALFKIIRVKNKLQEVEYKKRRK